MVQWRALADVEPFRQLPERHAVVRTVDHPTVVLGSTQSEALLAEAALAAAGVEMGRRRGGGGAVLLHPGDHLWVDAWIPRADPLWVADVAEAAHWVGAWWLAALGEVGLDGVQAHQGKAEPGTYGGSICFAGRGPGELFHLGAKVSGVSQWRSREGALFHTMAYRHWDVAPLVDLFEVDDVTRATWREDLAGAAVGIEDLKADQGAFAAVGDSLLASFMDWGFSAR